MTALYFGWLAFRNRHFVIGGGGLAQGWGGWGGEPPPPRVISIPALSP